MMWVEFVRVGEVVLRDVMSERDRLIVVVGECFLSVKLLAPLIVVCPCTLLFSSGSFCCCLQI